MFAYQLGMLIILLDIASKLVLLHCLLITQLAVVSRNVHQHLTTTDIIEFAISRVLLTPSSLKISQELA
jgi:hypothetical protein